MIVERFLKERRTIDKGLLNDC